MSDQCSWPCFGTSLFIVVSFMMTGTLLVYQSDSLEPASMPVHKLNGYLTEQIGVGLLVGPEDVVYSSSSRLIYTGCEDGWIKRVTVNNSAADSVVENWVNTGGRPLGLALGRQDEVIVADPEKGLLNISKQGQVEKLTAEVEGQKLKLIDSVDIAENGMIYFTEASNKYSLNEFMSDIVEGKPHGRLLSYDPTTKRTRVLLHDLYFANGLAVTPDQNYVIFCETVMKRCRKYCIQGKKKGSVKKFIDLPGLPDNIRYDGRGHYWISIAMAKASYHSWDQPEDLEEKGGILVVDTNGYPTAQYYDSELSLVSSGMQIGNYVYCGSLF
ncbi:hypothetical protein UlMin_039655 [Ulmus minor]